MEHPLLNHHPLSLGVTQTDIDFLRKMKKLEAKFLASGRMVRVNITNGYVLTTEPDRYQDYAK